MNPKSESIHINRLPLGARTVLLGMGAAVGLLLGGCAAYPGAYVDTGYSGPYYGDYGPYDGGDIIVGGYRHGGHYGDHHFLGNSFGRQGSSHGGGGGRGSHGGGGGRGR